MVAALGGRVMSSEMWSIHVSEDGPIAMSIKQHEEDSVSFFFFLKNEHTKQGEIYDTGRD